MSQTINSGVRKTRKLHRCEYCADLIPAGSVATWWSYSDCGRAGTAYAHPECDQMYQEMRESWWDDQPRWDDFRSECESRWPGRDLPWRTQP